MQLKNFQGMGMKINLFFFSDGLPRSSVDFFKKEAVGVAFFLHGGGDNDLRWNLSWFGLS